MSQGKMQYRYEEIPPARPWLVFQAKAMVKTESLIGWPPARPGPRIYLGMC